MDDAVYDLCLSLVSDKKDIYSWGRNASEQLGLSEACVLTPTNSLTVTAVLHSSLGRLISHLTRTRPFASFALA